MSPSLSRRNATEATGATPALAAALAPPPQHVSIREPQDTREGVVRLADRLDLAEEELLRFADAGAALGDCYIYVLILRTCAPRRAVQRRERERERERERARERERVSERETARERAR
jgi:hypothetical protein